MWCDMARSCDEWWMIYVMYEIDHVLVIGITTSMSRSLRVLRCTPSFSLLVSPRMILVTRRIFFELLLRSPIVVSELGLCVGVICMSRTQRVMGGNGHTAYQHVILWFGGIVGWSGPDRHYAYVYARLVLLTCFAHRWLAGVSFSNFSWIGFNEQGFFWR